MVIRIVRIRSPAVRIRVQMRMLLVCGTSSCSAPSQKSARPYDPGYEAQDHMLRVIKEILIEHKNKKL